MANGEQRFWMVWNKRNYRTPVATHDTKDAAQAEAKRLALKDPGNRFFVLEAIGSYKVHEPAVWKDTACTENL